MRLKLYTVYGRLKTGDAFKRFLMCGVEVQEDLVGAIGLFGFFELFQQGCETVDCPEMRGIERKGLAQISERKTVFAQAKEGARAAVPALSKSGGVICEGSKMLNRFGEPARFKRVLTAF